MGKSASAPAPPDYTPMAAASEKAAELGYKLGGEQLAEAKRQYGLNTELAKPILESQLKTMEQTAAQGQDYYDYMKSQQRPVEGALNEQAMRPDASAESLAERGLMTGSAAQLQADPRYGADIEQQAGQAGVDQMSGYSRALNVAARQGMRYGFNPAKIAAQAAAQAGGQASAQAAATNQARQAATERARGLVGAGRNLRLQDESTGWGKKMDTAGLYRGLVGASQGAYQTGISAGGAAMNTGMAPGQAYMSGMNQGAGLQMQGAQAGVQGQGVILGSQQKYGEMQAEMSAANANSKNQMVGTAIGAGIGGYAGFKSDRRLKEDIELVGKTRHDLNLYEFSYTEDPYTRYRGVMADEVSEVMPEAVSTGEDGFDRVNYNMLGIKMEEV